MPPESDGVEHGARWDEQGERWAVDVHPNPDQPEGDVGATVRRFVRGEPVDSYEFSFERDRDRAGTVYRPLPFVAPPRRLEATDVNRAKFEAATAVAGETGTRVSVGSLFSQRYLDALPEREAEYGPPPEEEAENRPPEVADGRTGRLGFTDEQWERFRGALRTVSEVLATRDRDQDTLDELDGRQLARIADALDAALEVLDEAAEGDEEQPSRER